MPVLKVEIGGTYWVKVSGESQRVRITGSIRGGGWYGINISTNRQICIKDYRRFIGRCQVKR